MRSLRLCDRSWPGAAGLFLCLGIVCASRAQLVNGGFENGDLSGWTAGGGGHVEALQAGGFAPALAPPEGSWFALLATGPGDVAGAPGGDFDANGTGDFDSTTLSVTFTTVAPDQNLGFQWAFITGDVQAGRISDDLFDVRVDGISILSGSVNKPGGVSPFTDSPGYDNIAYAVSSAGPTDGNAFPDGASPFRPFCLSIANPGTYTLEFLVADQGDASGDTGLLIDDVQVPSACDSTIVQRTESTGALVELKGGGQAFNPTNSGDHAGSQDGSVLAFVSDANLTGDNPNGIEQLFVRADGRFERITTLTGEHVGNPALTSNGRFVTFEAAGDLTPGNPGNADGNVEIFGFDRGTRALVQVTDTTACENRRPTVNNAVAGRRIAFFTDCSDLAPGFNADGNREIALWEAASGSFQFNETAGCASTDPAIARHDAGRYVAFQSDCDFTGGNADGNVEIFQWDRQSDSYRQITASAGSDNSRATASQDGRFVSFLSNADYTGGNADGSFEIFRFDRNAGGSFQQLTDESALVLHTDAHVEDTGRYVAFERLNFLTPTVTDALYADADMGTVTPVALGVTVADGLQPRMGVTSGAPTVAFLAANDLTGNNPDGNTELFQTGTPFAAPVAQQQCRTPGAAIPDDDPTGITDTLTVASGGALLDLDVSVDITHSFVGDLVVALTHVATGTSVTLIDRPGSPPGSGCSGDGLDAVLDDEAALPAETQCETPGPDAIAGTFTASALLGALDTEDLAGAWDLTVSDLASGDVGTLVEWCLIATVQP